MSSGNFNTTLTATPPLSVGQFYSGTTAPPGSIGLALSGGGSRALTAGMGQLQALSYLTFNGAPMLGQIKALSTVSGGSWLGVPYEFLPASGPSDSEFLGVFNPSIASQTLAELGTISSQSAAAPITGTLFSPLLLAVQAVVLYELNVPPNMIWQTIVGLNILYPAGLYEPNSSLAPTDLFSWDSQTLSTYVTGPNPSLGSVKPFLVASGSSRTPRPYYICNMAMFINQQGTKIQALAPVLATPFMTGIVGTPVGTDQNGLPPGGGGVTSFSFNSSLTSISGSAAVANQTRQWSLTDSAGTSSAFFAAILQNQIAYWEAHPLEFIATLAQYAEDIWNWIESHLTGEHQAKAKVFVQANRAVPEARAAGIGIPNPQVLIPQYGYWPVLDPTVVSNPQSTAFADGGILENSGVCALLAHSDIKAIVACANSQSPVAKGQYGVSDGKGGYLPDTYVIVDDSLPPLFGYQPYGNGQIDECNKGYVLYEGATCIDSQALAYAHNQVFQSDAFPALLKGLWNAANGNGSNSAPAIFTQALTVLANSWFGVQAGSVTVVWCHLNYVSAWANLFKNNPGVAAFIRNDVAQNNFPNYPTVNTNLSATQVNLMSNLTAWSIVAEEQANKTFSTLFKSFGG